MDTSELILPSHLTLRAAVYIRQSTPRQVLTNKESLRLQYALTQRAHALGWPATNERERSIVVTTQTKSLSADLIDQPMDGQQIEREWPVAKELTAFLVGDRPDAVVAHDWLTHITGDCRRPTASSTVSSSFKPIA